ncbi:MAG: efflux transporter outer membrane subunit [Methylotetracoccus sp.]|jgi:NodT family efflux transporter outer membrane factor (OMF) lipoprotein|nr:efflux transporter outer membrane subunit [Methylotetracoccus sp.]
MNPRWIAALAAVLLSGCPMVGPDYERPAVEIPHHWSKAASAEVGRVSKDNATWWRTFNDPVLNALVAQAIGFNPDVKQAKERIVQARSQRVIAVAAGLPLIDARGYANRRQNNFTGQSGNSVVGTAGGFGLGGQHIDIFQLGFDSRWELDVFGHIRRGIEAADARIGVEVENARDVLVTLLGEVARNYLDLRLAQRQIAIARDNLATQADTHQLTRQRNRAGLTSELDVTQARSQVATTEAQIPKFEARMNVAIHALAVLVGRNPSDLNRMLLPAGAIPVSPLRVIADLPSDLMRRRPDIQRAERHLAAATAEVGRATAELYPKLNLATFLGFQNNDVTDFTLLGKSWSIGSTLTAPVFYWGANIANLEAKEAGSREALWAYRSTVLNAFREVEDALVQYAMEQQRLEALQQAVEADELAVRLAEERYLRGLADFLNVLVAQRALLTSQAQAAESAALVSANLIAVYKALGGGWQVDRQLTGSASD